MVRTKGSTSVYTDTVGEIGGELYDDRCPRGQLVVGLEGGGVEGNFYHGVLSKFRVLCGTPKLPKDGTTEVTIGAGESVPDASNARGAEKVAQTRAM